MVKFSLNKLNELLGSLKGLRIKEAVSLRKRLEKEKIKLIPKEVLKVERMQSANVKRSSKLQRYWRYVKLIRDNFPDNTVKEIRKQLTVRQLGQETNIPDAVWQNPSP
ncbi:MAG: hypothetical protein IIA83_05210 [Thaumarchaeota archaeon]|nr:hypothetical protein [Nitrososphaerota archaeon]